jgi:CheY-like chemotaxis protein
MHSVSARQESTLKVLLIDDNADDLTAWSSQLQRCAPQYFVLKADSVSSALERCKDQPIDCVVLDLDLPQSSGFELLFELVPDRNQPKVPVIILTRLRNPALHQMTLDNGAQACLVKAFTSPQDLDAAIQKAITTVSSRDK